MVPAFFLQICRGRAPEFSMQAPWQTMQFRGGYPDYGDHPLMQRGQTQPQPRCFARPEAGACRARNAGSPRRKQRRSAVLT